MFIQSSRSLCRAIAAAAVLTLPVISPQGIAQQQAKPQIKPEPIKPVPMDDGAAMFKEYCAVCHGADGRGHGPAAAALKTAPVDLTQLSRKNGGKFPADHVQAVLRFGIYATPAHGNVDMPVWGDLFRSMSSPGTSDIQVQTRVRNLTRYLEKIQQ